MSVRVRRKVLEMSKAIVMTLLLLCYGNSSLQEKSAQEMPAAGSGNHCVPVGDIDSRQLELANGFDRNPETDPDLSGSNFHKDFLRQRFERYLFARKAGGVRNNKLRDGVIKYHICRTVNGHYRSGTNVYYLVKKKVFFLNGDCGMNHMDGMIGPFVGDPRKVLPGTQPS